MAILQSFKITLWKASEKDDICERYLIFILVAFRLQVRRPTPLSLPVFVMCYSSNCNVSQQNAQCKYTISSYDMDLCMFRVVLSLPKYVYVVTFGSIFYNVFSCPNVVSIQIIVFGTAFSIFYRILLTVWGSMCKYAWSHLNHDIDFLLHSVY